MVQVVERVLKRLMGKPGALPAAAAEEQTILVAHDLSPADVIQFKSHRYGAFLTDLGGVTSHTAIVARSLNVPAVVATHNARALIRDGEMLIVDGHNSVVIVNPDRAVLAEFRLKQSELELERQKLKRLRTKPADTLDGLRIELYANIELPEDLAATARSRCVGRRIVPLRVPVPQPSGPAVGGRAVRGLPARRRGHGTASRSSSARSTLARTRRRKASTVSRASHRTRRSACGRSGSASPSRACSTRSCVRSCARRTTATSGS